MAEMRRPGNFSKRDPGKPGRRSPPPPKPTPMWVKVGLIVAPLVLIGLVFNLGRKASTEVDVAPKVVVDPNARINELKKQVEPIKKEYRAWRELMVKEDPSAKPKQEALVERMQRWFDEWDNIFSKREDKDGNLPPELQGYRPIRAEMNQVREDVLKSSGF